MSAPRDRDTGWRHAVQQMMLFVEPLIPALRRYAAALTRDRSVGPLSIDELLRKRLGAVPADQTFPRASGRA
jgi:hypothetical protein